MNVFRIQNNIIAIMINDQRQRLAADAILQNFGVKENNTLDKIIGNMPGNEEISQIDESHYFKPYNLPEYLTDSDNNMKILILNVQTIFAKYSPIEILLNIFTRTKHKVWYFMFSRKLAEK